MSKTGPINEDATRALRAVKPSPHGRADSFMLAVQAANHEPAIGKQFDAGMEKLAFYPNNPVLTDQLEYDLPTQPHPMVDLVDSGNKSRESWPREQAPVDNRPGLNVRTVGGNG